FLLPQTFHSYYDHHLFHQSLQCLGHPSTHKTHPFVLTRFQNGIGDQQFPHMLMYLAFSPFPRVLLLLVPMLTHIHFLSFVKIYFWSCVPLLPDYINTQFDCFILFCSSMMFIPISAAFSGFCCCSAIFCCSFRD